MKAQLISIILLFTTLNVNADTQITVRDQSGNISSFSSNGKTARMNDSQNPGYVLIDLDKKVFRMVDPERREVMELSGLSGNTPVNPVTSVKVKILNKGNGPVIAGYNTRQYLLQANGKNCTTIYGSKKVLALEGIEEIFIALKKVQQQSLNMSRAFRGSGDSCDQAELQMSDVYRTTGAPLRLLDDQGKVENEVLKIDTRASHPMAYYDTPTGYSVTNMEEKMNQARQQNQQAMEQMQNSMPDMNKLMQQMQQQGMPPEAMERMKKMQEKFKQQYQQQ